MPGDGKNATNLSNNKALDFLFGNMEDPIFRRTVNEYFFSFVPLILAEIFMTWLPAIKKKKQLY